jgi:peptidoglycan/LPS O-acetylase OafA/YrhL
VTPAYRPQLDALRAFAVLAVMASHFWPALPSFGFEAVRLFFVLSGFLITSQLLDERAALAADAGARARWARVGRFVVRRGLRIFPAYYALLIVLAAFGAPGVREDFAVFAAYLSNFYFAARNSWEPWQLAHTWSLAVEEQFYLVWPVVVMFVPRRWLAPLVVVLIGIAPLYRALLAAGSTVADAPLAAFVLPPTCFDALGLGALLALWRQHRARRWLPAAGVAAFVLCAGVYGFAPSDWLDRSPGVVLGLLASLLALAACAAVDAAARGVSGPVGTVLDHRALHYLGRISYGLYLYHPLVLWALASLPPKVGLPAVASGPLMLVLGSVLTVALAAASWHAFELPLNRLKRFFA